MAPRPESDSEMKQTELSRRLTREIIGRELRELYEISEELPGYLQELMAELENRDE